MLEEEIKFLEDVMCKLRVVSSLPEDEAHKTSVIDGFFDSYLLETMNTTMEQREFWLEKQSPGWWKEYPISHDATYYQHQLMYLLQTAGAETWEEILVVVKKEYATAKKEQTDLVKGLRFVLYTLSVFLLSFLTIMGIGFYSTYERYNTLAWIINGTVFTSMIVVSIGGIVLFNREYKKEVKILSDLSSHP